MLPSRFHICELQEIFLESIWRHKSLQVNKKIQIFKKYFCQWFKYPGPQKVSLVLKVSSIFGDRMQLSRSIHSLKEESHHAFLSFMNVHPPAGWLWDLSQGPAHESDIFFIIHVYMKYCCLSSTCSLQVLVTPTSHLPITVIAVLPSFFTWRNWGTEVKWFVKFM